MPLSVPDQPSDHPDRRPQDLTQLRIVLVEPSHPGNIGGVARALKTMGLSQLVLVAPKRYPDPQAEWRAAGAQDVLKDARVVASVDEAIADCHLIVGTSTRSRTLPWPIDPVVEAAPKLLAASAHGPVAILFGREDNGLSNDELQRCHFHVAIPANPDYSSLNLAMAVQVLCYELFRHSELTNAIDPSWDKRAARSDELEGFFGHLETVLTEIDFHDPSNPGQALTRFRRLFTRIRPDETEVAMLRGVLSNVQRAAKKPGAADSGE